MGKITKDDSIMIKGLQEAKQWSSRRLIREFPQWYSVMVDTSSMFDELKSTTLVLWT